MADYTTNGKTIAGTTNGSEVDTALFVGGLGKSHYVYNSSSERLYATHGSTPPSDPNHESILIAPGGFADLGIITGTGSDIYIKLLGEGSSVLWEAAQGTAPAGGGVGEGSQGPKGDKGDPGKDGADGKDGGPGQPGADGKDGDPGADGKDGATGSLEVDLNADYKWHGSHVFDGAGDVEFTNQIGAAITFDGWGSDYTGEGHEHAWFKVKQNSNGENWMYFGPTSSYWENRVSLGSGNITFAQNTTSSPSVKIDKSGLKVNGSSVSRNATLLSALRSSSNFDELKAKLIEALEAEEAEE